MEQRGYRGPGFDGVFHALKPEDLLPNAVAASCMDDQYIDRETLLSRGDLYRQRYTDCVLQEFSKCLLSAEQVVINRAYLQNTEVMHHLAPPPGDAADDTPIVRLIDEGSVVPYLYDDQDPTLKATIQNRVIGADTASAWNRVCERTEPRCVRMSWDESADSNLRSERLSSRFAARLVSLAEDAQPDLLCRLERDPPPEKIEAFGHFLKSALLPIARDLPTRRELYERLVIRDGTDIGKTQIDPGKKFAHALKQLIDLVYNANLAGALAINNVSPSQSISADLLADAGLESLQAKKVSWDLAAHIVATAARLQRAHYDQNNVPVLGTLSLEQVVRIRDHHSWRQYIRAVSRLHQVDASLDDATYARHVEEALGTVLERCEKLRDYLYQHHGAKRQSRDRTRSVIAQSGSLCLGAIIGSGLAPLAAAAGMPIPDGGAANFASNLAGGAIQTLTERPLRYLATKIDPLGRTFAAARLPDLQLDGKAETLAKFNRELNAMGVTTLSVDPTAVGSPTVEAEVRPS